LIAVRAASLGEGGILSRDLARSMLSPQLGSGWGLGPALSFHGAEVAGFGHGGANEGFRCEAGIDLATGNGVVVMLNSDDGAPLTDARAAVAGAYGWVRDLPVTAEEAARITGLYDLDGMRMRITFDGGKVVSQAFGQPAFRLRAQGGLVFVPTFDDYARLAFAIAADGSVALTLEQGRSSVTGTRR
jgi:hypothetical protein